MNGYLFDWGRHLGCLSLLVNTLTCQRTYAVNPSATIVARLTGVITDEQNQPIPDVNIIEKQTRKGTVTDAAK